jgi:hypothetical protein
MSALCSARFNPGGLQVQSWCRGKEKNSVSNRNRNPVVQPVTLSISTGLFWILVFVAEESNNKTDNVHTAWHWGAFVQPLLSSKIKNCYIIWLRSCSFSYPACNAHGPCWLLWPARLYNIFPHYLINGKILEDTLLNIKCAFWFSLQVLSATFIILRRNELYMTTDW